MIPAARPATAMPVARGAPPVLVSVLLSSSEEAVLLLESLSSDVLSLLLLSVVLVASEPPRPSGSSVEQTSMTSPPREARSEQAEKTDWRSSLWSLHQDMRSSL